MYCWAIAIAPDDIIYTVNNPSSKDHRININKTSIRRFCVGSMSDRCRTGGLCYPRISNNCYHSHDQLVQSLSIYRGHFPLKTHETHPIARPWRRGMGCSSWMQSLTGVLPLQLLCHAQYRVVYNRDISRVYSSTHQFVYTRQHTKHKGPENPSIT